MPTENRSSNPEQMVSLPLDLVELALAHLPSDSAAGFELRDLLAQPAAQHQGNPVAYLDLVSGNTFEDAEAIETAGRRAIPLYDHPPTSDGFSAGDMADQGAKAFAARDPEVEQLRAQLAEQGSLLQRCVMAVREQHCEEGEAEFDLPIDLMSDIDAALLEIANKEWRMNPCKQGHRDVGACNGKAFCHQCDELITATTTQEAFEQWNATHPPVSAPNTPE
ncbi:hypothetical protein [Pseudomonas sp. Hg5Tf]|uniref:Uncharacterized protein n=1 Tax=Pseudomonas sp. Hg7Tf TaxID=3236988 RepID=A0AB39I5R0_9PSED|nr:hypothetical protein [Pseudomonas sp. Hg5Tf]MDH2558354.1 hypothetical protein [Pseudomonas sp. Hg5Tf]